MTLVIDPGGTVRCIYDDLLDFATLGKAVIKRASNVEPTDDGLWTADLGPLNGPVLGPYRRRGEALDAEHEWLESWLGGSGTRG